MTLHPIPLNILIYEENYIFFFISAWGCRELAYTVQSWYAQSGYIKKCIGFYDMHSNNLLLLFCYFVFPSVCLLFVMLLTYYLFLYFY
jgi:hypothetical protein